MALKGTGRGTGGGRGAESGLQPADLGAISPLPLHAGPLPEAQKLALNRGAIPVLRCTAWCWGGSPFAPGWAAAGQGASPWASGVGWDREPAPGSEHWNLCPSLSSTVYPRKGAGNRFTINSPLNSPAQAFRAGGVELVGVKGRGIFRQGVS